MCMSGARAAVENSQIMPDLSNTNSLSIFTCRSDGVMNVF